MSINEETKIDSFTAEALLSALGNGMKNDSVVDLYKQIKRGGDEGPTDEQIREVGRLLGRTVKIKGTDHIAVVISLNSSNRGFYPGGRYPANVRITDSSNPEAIGEIFEYGLEQIEEMKFKKLMEENMLVTNKDILNYILGDGFKVSTKGSKIKKQFRSAWYRKDVIEWLLLKIKYAKYPKVVMESILTKGPLETEMVLKDLAIWYKLIGEEVFDKILFNPETKEKIISKASDIKEFYKVSKYHTFIYSEDPYKDIIKNPYAYATVKATI